MSKREKLSQESVSEIKELMLENIEKGKANQLFEVVGMGQEEITNQLEKCGRIVANHAADESVVKKGKMDAFVILKEMLKEEVHPLLAFVYTYQVSSTFNQDQESTNPADQGSYINPNS